MIVQCPQCQGKYKVDDAVVAGRQQITVHCTKCNSNFTTPVAPPPEVPSGATLAPPELPADKRFALAATRGPVKGETFVLTKPKSVLGRAGTDVVINDPEVSRKHCALEIHGATAVLVDLGSTNGTFIDDERIDSREIDHLTEFRIGQTVLMFTVSNTQ
jgi:predicted Zn finger-like uncharacterized protein